MTSAYLSESSGWLRLSPAQLPLPLHLECPRNDTIPCEHCTAQLGPSLEGFGLGQVLEVYSAALTIMAEMAECWEDARPFIKAPS